MKIIAYWPIFGILITTINVLIEPVSKFDKVSHIIFVILCSILSSIGIYSLTIKENEQ